MSEQPSRQQRYYHRHKEKILEQRRIEYNLNKNRSRSLQIYHKRKKVDPEFVQRRRDYGKKYYQQHSEALREKSRQQHKADSSYWQKYYTERKNDPAFIEKRRAYALQYYHKNKDRLNAARHKREQAKKPPSTIVPLEERENPFLLALF